MDATLTWLQSQPKGRLVLGLLVTPAFANAKRSRSPGLPPSRGSRMPVHLSWLFWNLAMRLKGVSKGTRQRVLLDAARKDMGCPDRRRP